MGEGAGPVFLDEEMTGPGKKVGDDDAGERGTWRERQNRERHAEQPDDRPGIVQRARAGVGMLVHIITPELLISPAVLCHGAPRGLTTMTERRHGFHRRLSPPCEAPGTLAKTADYASLGMRQEMRDGEGRIQDRQTREWLGL